MHHERQDQLICIIGKADLCELLSAAFSFPNEALIQALCKDTFAKDAIACLQEANANDNNIEAARSALQDFSGKDQAVTLSEMRKEYSILYLAPGSSVPVFPYEAAFRFVEDGRKGSPALFRSPITLDVERQMREAGTALRDAQREPCDSVFGEFEFMGYLFARYAEAFLEEDALVEEEWLARITSFCEEHAEVWLPSFMQLTQQKSSEICASSSYANLASFALKVLPVIFEKSEL